MSLGGHLGNKRGKQLSISFQPHLVKSGPTGINSPHIFRLHRLECTTSKGSPSPGKRKVPALAPANSRQKGAGPGRVLSGSV